MKSLFVLAGEHSGDLHGGPLLASLRQQFPGLRITGVGGPAMQAQGLESVLPLEAFQVFGFTDILWKFPKLYEQFYKVRDTILRQQPDAVIFIDYPGFNLRMAKSLRRKGYKGKLIHYVCPTVWAWGRGRIRAMADTLDLLLTIFPFEPPLFGHTKLNVQFIGHPLVEKLQHHPYTTDWYQKCGVAAPKHALALFPGSRPGEIQRLLPRQLAAGKLLKTQMMISCADESLIPLLDREIEEAGLQVGKDVHIVPRRYTYDLMRDCHTALAKSGTVTLELALHRKPTVVVYDITTVNYLIAKYLLRLNLPHYCIVNILCGQEVFPEFIEQCFTAQDLATKLTPLHTDCPVRMACLEGCQRAFEALKTENDQSVAQRATQAISQLMDPS